VAGGVSGGLVAYRWARHTLARPPVPEVWVPRQFERFARQLDLTPEQRQQIQPILEKNVRQLMELRQQSIRSGREIIDRMDSEVANQLTAEQRTKFERIVKERRDAWRRIQDRSGKGGRDHPPGARPGEAPPPPVPEPKATGT